MAQHPAIAFAARPREFIVGERGHDDAGADRIDPPAAPGPAHCFRFHAQGIAGLRELVGMQRIGHCIRCQHRQCQQVFGRCRRERLVLLGRQSGKAVARLRGDDHSRTACGDHIAKQFEHQRGAVKINFEDGFR